MPAAVEPPPARDTADGAPAARPGGTAALLLLALFAAASIAWWVAQGWPRAVAEPGAAPGDERIACLSYAPYRRPGQTPFDPEQRVSRQQIEADLRILATRTDCVRTYSIDQGLDQVPAVARELGMTVLLGAWLGRDRARNDEELALAVALARAESAVVRAVVVGNEVLLRRELPEHALRAAIVQVRQALRDAKPDGSAIPVTYADVWEFWLEHPALAEVVDFVTIHALPYWEDEPVGIDQAVAHVVATYRLAQAALPGRDILLGETGWPRAGRARRSATAGRVEQARFVREFVRAARIEGIPYNLIEAFDQPWKRSLEGAMGGHWGLFDSAGTPAFPWHGRVEADPRWRDGLAGGAFGALVFALLALASRARARDVLGHALAGLAVGALAVVQFRHAIAWQRDGYEWLLAIAGMASSALFGWLAARHLLPPQPAIPALPAIHTLLRDLAAPGRLAARSRHVNTATLLGALRFAFLFAAAFTIVLLVFDARYRGFPWPFFAVPLGAALLLAMQGERLPPDAREERALAVVAVLGAPFVLAFETLANREALVFLGVLLAYVAACFGMPSRLDRAPGARGTRTSTSSPSSAPSADGSNE